jgi:hypothetical protein
MPRITPEERARRREIIERFLAADGPGSEDSLATWKRISVALEMPFDGIRQWWRRQGTEKIRDVSQRLGPTHYGSRQRMDVTRRVCLGADCGAVFASSGPGHRLCGSCRLRSPSPYSPGGGGDTGRKVGARRA